MYKTVTAEEAVKVVKSNDKIYIQAAAAAPQFLIKALTDRHEELRNVEICHFIPKEKHLMQILNMMKVFMSIPFLLEKM